jgi:hypothetical protein
VVEFAVLAAASLFHVPSWLSQHSSSSHSLLFIFSFLFHAYCTSFFFHRPPPPQNLLFLLSRVTELAPHDAYARSGATAHLNAHLLPHSAHNLALLLDSTGLLGMVPAAHAQSSSASGGSSSSSIGGADAHLADAAQPSLTATQLAEALLAQFKRAHLLSSSTSSTSSSSSSSATASSSSSVSPLDFVAAALVRVAEADAGLDAAVAALLVTPSVLATGATPAEVRALAIQRAIEQVCAHTRDARAVGSMGLLSPIAALFGF